MVSSEGSSASTTSPSRNCDPDSAVSDPRASSWSRREGCELVSALTHRHERFGCGFQQQEGRSSFVRWPLEYSAPTGATAARRTREAPTRTDPSRRPEPADAPRQVDGGVTERLACEPRGRGRNEHQAAVGHQVRLVESHRNAVDVAMLALQKLPSLSARTAAAVTAISPSYVSIFGGCARNRSRGCAVDRGSAPVPCRPAFTQRSIVKPRGAGAPPPAGTDRELGGFKSQYCGLR